MDVAEARMKRTLLIGLCTLVSLSATTAGSVQIESGAGLCLDVHAPCQKKNGCKVQVWECGGEQQQQWTIDKGEIRSGALNTEY